MGRHAEGWKLEWRRGIGYVRFTHAKRQHLVSTGKRDPVEATAEAGRLYARVVSGGAARPASTRHLIARPLPELLAEWVASLRGSLDAETIKTYEEIYVAKHWLDHYSTLGEMCDEAARERYRSARLKKATADTVKKETWAQDKFLRWCKKPMKLIGVLPDRLEWDSKMLGTRTGKQRKRARKLTPEQVEAVLAALPEWFKVGTRALEKTPYPIRARFVFAYETSLRPATLSELRWDDWEGEGSTLVIRAEADKIRYGREVPLSPLARAALESVRDGARARGLPTGPADLVFGAHLYRKTLLRAAKAAGLDGVAPYDFRHARGTHLADAGGSLTGIGHLMGHKQATTTNRYLHASMRAAKETLQKGAPEAELPGIGPMETQNPRTKQGDRRGSNPRHLEPQGTGSHSDTGTYPDVGRAGDRVKTRETAPSQVQDPEKRSVASAELRAFRAVAWLRLRGAA